MRHSNQIPLIVIMFTGVLYFGCNSDSNPNAKDPNPNGSSELAILMRDMFDDGMRTKQQILDGKSPEIHVPYHHMFTATPTEPEKVASPEYVAFANMYESTTKAFLESVKENRIASYQSMVSSCINCHEVLCPGPTMKIKKMYLSEREIKVIGEAGDRF